jgi:diguanylate cyclase (GGDEF)-like protein
MIKTTPLRTVPLRTGLGLTILLMGAFSILLVFVSEMIYRSHAIDNQRQALVQLVRLKSTDLIEDLEKTAGRLGLEIQQPAAFRQAFRANDRAAMESQLDSRFEQYFVTAGVLKLEKLLIFDAKFKIVAASGNGIALPADNLQCPSLVRDGQARSGTARLQPVSRLCTLGATPLFSVMVPIGLLPDGYVQVTTDPRHDLARLEDELGMPLRLTLADGAVTYQSASWSTRDADSLDIEYPLLSADGARILTATLRMDVKEFFANLRRTRDLVMLMVAIATIVTVLLTRLLTERLIVQPLQTLCNHLRRRDRSLLETVEPDGKHVISEFAELKELYGVLEDISLTDPLTGLANRVQFERRLDALLHDDSSAAREHTACYMDLDHFKIVNDTCGHPAGDRLLQEIAVLFRQQVRSDDLVARIGGDEFAVLLEDCPPDDARTIAHSFITAINNYHFIRDGHTFTVGVSIGMVPFRKGSLLTEIIGAADAACYLAKEHGRNRIHYYRADDSELLQRRDETRWANRITRALDNDRFELFAQPIHPAVIGAASVHMREVLLWMIDDEGNRISPREFIPAAERYNLMDAIDRWVIRQLCLQLGAISEHDSQNTYAINLSGQSLSDDNFLHFLIDTLDHSHIPTNRLCFEITETAAITNLAKATHLISILKGMGIRFALDDFGSGLSSFTYLKHLSVDYVKIDGSFVRGMAGNPVDCRMVEAIHQMAHAMNIQTIAESVENEESYSLLQEIGVDFLQGYYIGRPLPISNFLRLHRPARDTSARVVPIR